MVSLVFNLIPNHIHPLCFCVEASQVPSSFLYYHLIKDAYSFFMNICLVPGTKFLFTFILFVIIQVMKNTVFVRRG